jgi:transglutaminase-like putative cysteine protease
VADILDGHRLAERRNGGWRLRIEHTTSVWYPCPVLASSNEARMTPPTLPTQVTLESRVTVGPGVPVWTYTDYWGTIVSVFNMPEPHDALVIRAAATVETCPAGGIPGPEGRPTWTALREMAANSRLAEFLVSTPLTTVTEEVSGSVATEIAGLPPDAAAEAISARVRERVAYQPGATDADTSAQRAWDAGRGVCQDMAQLTVALLRAVGMPARYVSGYLHPWELAEPGSTAVGRSHAWAEYWAGAWTPLDPTTGTAVGERHVVVARGRDYDDVPPLKGAYRGPSAADTRVTVEVTRLA